MGTNMYPSSSLVGDKKDDVIGAMPADELIENADGFAGVFPGEYDLFHCFEALRMCCLFQNLTPYATQCRAQVRDCEEAAGNKAHSWNDRGRGE